MRISYGKNVYNKAEVKAVLKTLKTGTQMGRAVKIFENKVSNMFSKKYGLMVNSGSSALTLAMNSLNIKKNDEIITPCLNFGTAVSSIIIAGAKPIFVDVNLETLQIDTNKIEKKITKRTIAFLIPNLIGNIPNLKKIHKLKKKYNLKLIEDSADTLGAKIGDKPTGYYSDISITSFYGSHVISCAGNGGMFMTNNKSVYDKAKVLRSWGRMSSLIKNSEDINERLNIKLMGCDYDKKFVFSELGYNFEPSEIGASFGIEQLKKFRKFSKKRLENFNYHKKFFDKFETLFISPIVNRNIYTNFLAYPLIIKENKLFKRKHLQVYLEENNIQTRPIFSGNILRHPAFKNLINSRNHLNNFKNSDYIMRNGILIGCHQGLNLNNLDYIHDKINKFIKINN
tara:strand:+ start:6514 stop:7707 length:1194 start_codon:yes stop_codon:yes gene_type:complete